MIKIDEKRLGLDSTALSLAGRADALREPSLPRRSLLRGRSEQGSALVEMAIVLPLMLLILTGIASFSMALYQKLLLTEAVSSAGRVLAAEQGQSDPCADTWTALTRSAPGLASSGLSMSITWIVEPAGTTHTYTANTCTSMGASVKSGDYAQVYASYPCVLQVFQAGFQSCTVAAAVAEDIQ